jgi:hypothetical protein
MLTSFDVYSTRGITVFHPILVDLADQCVKSNAAYDVTFDGSLDNLIDSLRLQQYFIYQNDCVVRGI